MLFTPWVIESRNVFHLLLIADTPYVFGRNLPLDSSRGPFFAFLVVSQLTSSNVDLPLNRTLQLKEIILPSLIIFVSWE
jgi:hypothetical protein